jgi:pimeloyl-ACP methyl ester carboxylesterase
VPVSVESAEHVIVVHGIWMRGIAMLPLARRLRSAGFSVETFDYRSVTGAWSGSLARLCERWRHQPAGRVHVVGHSLGGMLALDLAAQEADLPAGRIVCLGSPLRGSTAASRLQALPGGRLLMGKSPSILHEGLQAWDGEREVGVIAGSTPIGLGALIAPLERPHDGTVSVAETRLPGIREHRVVESTHTGLLFSAEVASLTAGFLRDGRFAANAGASR